VDTSVLNFFEKFQENSLLTDVNIYIDGNFVILDEYEDLPQALTKIAPFITSIDSIYTQGIDLDLLKMVYYNTNHGNNTETQLLLMEMMAKTRILYSVDRLVTWLYIFYCLFCSLILPFLSTVLFMTLMILNRGKIKVICAALGFAPPGMMGSREC
jgi:hypothetical protein